MILVCLWRDYNMLSGWFGDDCCKISELLWVDLGVMLGDFGVSGWLGDDYGMNLVWFSLDFEMIVGWCSWDLNMCSGWLWDDSEVIWGWCWDASGMILGWSWCALIMVSGWLWDDLGRLWNDFGVQMGWHCLNFGVNLVWCCSHLLGPIWGEVVVVMFEVTMLLGVLEVWVILGWFGSDVRMMLNWSWWWYWCQFGHLKSSAGRGGEDGERGRGLTQHWAVRQWRGELHHKGDRAAALQGLLLFDIFGF